MLGSEAIHPCRQHQKVGRVIWQYWGHWPLHWHDPRNAWGRRRHGRTHLQVSHPWPVCQAQEGRQVLLRPWGPSRVIQGKSVERDPQDLDGPPHLRQLGSNQGHAAPRLQEAECRVSRPSDFRHIHEAVAWWMCFHLQTGTSWRTARTKKQSGRSTSAFSRIRRTPRGEIKSPDFRW